MQKLFSRGLILVLLLALTACSKQPCPPSDKSFQAGRDYQVIPTPPAGSLALSIPPGKVLVQEYFSYACPWCFRLEPGLEIWLANKPKDVVFERVPVVFETGWDTLAKIYYTAKGLGIAEKTIMPIFNALQVKNIDMTTDANIIEFFGTQGIKQQDFESAFDFSPGIDAQMIRGDKLMRQFGVFAVPAFVINGKYMINMAMSNGDDKRMLQTVDYLIAKERKGAK